MASRDIGFVYVLTNPSMPGLVKVGQTSWLPEDRAKKLYTTGVPEEFEVAFRVASSRYEQVERRAHEILGSYRGNPVREYFRVALDVAINAVKRALAEEAGIEAWQSPGPQVLRAGDRVGLSLRGGQMFTLLAIDFMDDVASPFDFWQAHADGDTLEIHAVRNPAHVAGLSDEGAGAEIDPVPFIDRSGVIPNGVLNGKERLYPGDRLVWTSESNGECISVVFEADSYCQVFSRTWSPQCTPEGIPLLLNIPTASVLPEGVVKEVRKALTLPMPGTWAPRYLHESEGWAPVAADPQPPEYWMPQLAPRRRRKR
ncbi:GIY-YIG nuclease family protein [Streptomyces sp. NPDC006147]|uniref:GIY-YIG nuclease family protein n=1 Tax=Streptomyces sp. NPDC006147 TaxID=3155597 RepID=UPI0033B08BB4